MIIFLRRVNKYAFTANVIIHQGLHSMQLINTRKMYNTWIIPNTIIFPRMICDDWFDSKNRLMCFNHLFPMTKNFQFWYGSVGARYKRWNIDYITALRLDKNPISRTIYEVCNYWRRIYHPSSVHVCNTRASHCN